jgi:lactoylglutathione lyase
MDSKAQPQDFNPRYWIAGTEAKVPRVLHTMLRVSDPKAALEFYVDLIGMKLIDVFEVEANRLTAYFLAFDETQVDGFLELAYVEGADTPYSHGTGYGHVSIGAPDFASLVAKLEATGVEFVVKPMRLFPGGPQLTLVKDPDGYVVEFIQGHRDHGVPEEALSPG